jgi:uncharacterized membrane protein YozB (DUF420 family)
VIGVAHAPPIMIEVADLPGVNAALNAVATTLLVAGYAAIRAKRVAVHRACMLSAFAASTLFLASYVVYHWHAGSRPYMGTGAARAIYLSILISHVILAAAVPPLALVTLARALQARFDRHRRIARWTLPIWLYVSVTGVLVYLMLYVW